jgi:hypothetical protein
LFVNKNQKDFAKEVDERIKAFRTPISQAEKEKWRLENIL